MTGLSDEQDRARFDALYQCHLKHLKLKGLQPKTIDACATPSMLLKIRKLPRSDAPRIFAAVSTELGSIRSSTQRGTSSGS